LRFERFEPLERIELFKPFRCAGKSRQGVVNESFIQ
jgi:hypothetical protein